MINEQTHEIIASVKAISLTVKVYIETYTKTENTTKN